MSRIPRPENGTRVPFKQHHGIVGFDLSLTAPAACFIPRGWELGDWKALRYETRPTDGEPPKVEPVELLRWKYARLIKISGWARDFVLTLGAGHVFVEDYAFSKSSSSVTKLGELGGVCRVELLTYGRVMRPLSASTGRKMILGKVPKKDSKIATHQALWDHGAPFSNGDECDSFVCANAGLAELGLPFLTLYEGNQESFDAAHRRGK